VLFQGIARGFDRPEPKPSTCVLKPSTRFRTMSCPLRSWNVRRKILRSHSWAMQHALARQASSGRGPARGSPVQLLPVPDAVWPLARTWRVAACSAIGTQRSRNCSIRRRRADPRTTPLSRGNESAGRRASPPLLQSCAHAGILRSQLRASLSHGVAFARQHEEIRQLECSLTGAACLKLHGAERAFDAEGSSAAAQIACLAIGLDRSRPRVGKSGCCMVKADQQPIHTQVVSKPERSGDWRSACGNTCRSRCWIVEGK